MILSVTQDDKGHNPNDELKIKPFTIRGTSRAPRSLPRNHRSVIGVLNYLSALTRTGTYVVAHHVDRFCVDPKQNHEKTATGIARYSQASSCFGSIYKVDKNRGLEVHAITCFA